MDYREQFRVSPGSTVTLSKIDPDFKDKHENEKSVAEELAKYAERLRALQYLLYAEGKRSVLICLQAMDAGGKDGTIRHVLGAMNPQGCRVQTFKVPTPREAAHDFLWRIHKPAPAKGEVAIYNRSHYEDVLVPRVHRLIPEQVWIRRYDQINAFEKHLAENATVILKFFLHISKDEQLSRFKRRLDDPARHWKISENDYRERESWDDYMRAIEDALGICSTAVAPWYVIPANHKWFRNLAVSQIVVDTLADLKMQLPAPSVDIEKIRVQYHQAAKEQAQ